jgi:hypothetical protein
MTKVDLISKVAKEAKTTKVAAGKAIDCVTNSITQELKRGGEDNSYRFWNLLCGKAQGQDWQKPPDG